MTRRGRPDFVAKFSDYIVAKHLVTISAVTKIIHDVVAKFSDYIVAKNCDNNLFCRKYLSSKLSLI